MIQKLKSEDGKIEAIVEIKNVENEVEKGGEYAEEAMTEKEVETVAEPVKKVNFTIYIWVFIILFFLYFIALQNDKEKDVKRSPNTSPSKIISFWQKR